MPQGNSHTSHPVKQPTSPPAHQPSASPSLGRRPVCCGCQCVRACVRAYTSGCMPACMPGCGGSLACHGYRSHLTPATAATKAGYGNPMGSDPGLQNMYFNQYPEVCRPHTSPFLFSFPFLLSLFLQLSPLSPKKYSPANGFACRISFISPLPGARCTFAGVGQQLSLVVLTLLHIADAGAVPWCGLTAQSRVGSWSAGTIPSHVPPANATHLLLSPAATATAAGTAAAATAAIFGAAADSRTAADSHRTRRWQRRRRAQAVCAHGIRI